MKKTTLLFVMLIALISIPVLGGEKANNLVDQAKIYLKAGDYDAAIPLLQEAADQGAPVAQSCLGYCYTNGLGVEQDYKEALKWYHLAADQGDLFSQSVLGAAYLFGKGVEQSDEKAFKYIRLAAEQGDPNSLYNLGMCYYRGTGAEVDYDKALECFREAAEMGVLPAIFMIGTCYQDGTGVEKDLEKAAELYQRALDAGYEPDEEDKVRLEEVLGEKAVEVKINALPSPEEVGLENKRAIEEAKEAYDALTDYQKSKVDPAIVEKLKKDEAALAAAEEKRDTDAAKAVEDKINDLPSSDKVKVEDKTAIEAARAAYNSLTDSQKAKVSETAKQKLLDVETALSNASKAADTPLPAMNDSLTVTQKGSKLNIKWIRVPGAEGYDVYASYSNKAYGKPVKSVDNLTTGITIKKLNGKKLNRSKIYKVYVAAYRTVNGQKETVKSIEAFIAGDKNARYTNAKKIKLKKKNYRVGIDKKAKIKASIVLQSKGKKILPKKYAPKFRYRSSDESIVIVKEGKIKGLKAGTCEIYVYAANGLSQKIVVTVG